MARSLVLILLLVLLPFSAYGDVSIDCGATGVHTDENSIIWTGDDTIMENGLSEVVQSSNKVSSVMSTLRVFPSRKKNCYSIDAEKGGQALVRASFFYGNYDRKSAPPTFDMHFDGNFWATVQTSLDQLVYYEVVYVAKGDTISVCLSQTQPNQFPFISALEVRSLASNMYSHVDSNYAMFLKSRFAYGANSTIRYSDDGYDRIWVPAIVGDGLTVVTSDEIFIDTSTVADNPPQAAVQNAVTTTGTSNITIFGATVFPTKEVPVYITMYFSEVQQLDTTQTRSFRIYTDSDTSSDPIVPPYGSVTEMYISNTTASANTKISLVATADSTLPPLINAMEVFSISDPLTDGTNSDDVAGLGELQNMFTKLQEWVGDPCLPYPYTWDWINCSTDATPRVTALYLSSFNLEGELPDFSSMDALETIDLHNNSISGSIPAFLGTLPNLKLLNLADNSFSGPIPTSISKNKNLKLVVSGNPDLCISGKSCQTTSASTDSGVATPSGRGKKSSKLPVILGTTIPAFIVVWAIVGFLAVVHHKRKTAAVAALAGGNAEATNRPNGAPHAQGAQPNNGIMMGKFGQAVMNEIKVNIQEQVQTQINNQFNGQDQNHDNQDGRDNN